MADMNRRYLWDARYAFQVPTRVGTYTKGR